jgi:hypothetical protein
MSARYVPAAEEYRGIAIALTVAMITSTMTNSTSEKPRRLKPESARRAAVRDWLGRRVVVLGFKARLHITSKGSGLHPPIATQYVE